MRIFKLRVYHFKQWTGLRCCHTLGVFSGRLGINEGGTSDKEWIEYYQEY